jgi:hypothetical protein
VQQITNSIFDAPCICPRTNSGLVCKPRLVRPGCGAENPFRPRFGVGFPSNACFYRRFARVAKASDLRSIGGIARRFDSPCAHPSVLSSFWKVLPATKPDGCIRHTHFPPFNLFKDSSRFRDFFIFRDFLHFRDFLFSGIGVFSEFRSRPAIGTDARACVNARATFVRFECSLFVASWRLRCQYIVGTPPLHIHTYVL